MSSIGLKHKDLSDDLLKNASALVNYVEMAADSGFTDNASALEELVKTYYTITRKWDLKNTNEIRHNYPAIDLIDDKNKIAIQVTITANTKKIKHTIAEWTKLNKGDYQLVIIGITGKSSTKAKAEVLTLAELMDKVTKLDFRDLQLLHKEFLDRINPQTYFLRTDDECIDLIIKYMDRGALRHLHQSQGDYERMYSSLRKAKDYIVRGEVEDYQVKIKPLALIRKNQEILQQIEYKITDILALCDRSRTNGQINDMLLDFKRVDDLKNAINELVKRLG